MHPGFRGCLAPKVRGVTRPVLKSLDLLEIRDCPGTMEAQVLKDPLALKDLQVQAVSQGNREIRALRGTPGSRASPVTLAVLDPLVYQVLQGSKEREEKLDSPVLQAWLELQATQDTGVALGPRVFRDLLAGEDPLDWRLCPSQWNRRMETRVPLDIQVVLETADPRDHLGHLDDQV